MWQQVILQTCFITLRIPICHTLTCVYDFSSFLSFFFNQLISKTFISPTVRLELHLMWDDIAILTRYLLMLSFNDCLDGETLQSVLHLRSPWLRTLLLLRTHNFSISFYYLWRILAIDGKRNVWRTVENMDFDFKGLSGWGRGQRSRISEERNYAQKQNENLAQLRFLFSCLFTCSIANLKSHCISSVM